MESARPLYTQPRPLRLHPHLKRAPRPTLTLAQRRGLDLEIPKAQLFSKTDLAKFEFSAVGQPHIVSRGAQKNFAEFAKDIGEAWSRSDARYDELWYKRLIAKVHPDAGGTSPLAMQVNQARDTLLRNISAQ